MSIIEFIRDRARYYNCPVCGRNLRACEVRMLNHKEDRFTVQVTCAACRVNFIVVLAIQSAVSEAVLEADEELALETAAAAVEAPLAADRPGPIDVDEILDLHLFLQDFEGSFDELLKAAQRS